MSARGRGRGRGIPIAYPDGWACKPPSASLPTWTPSQPFVVSAADREMLDLKKRVLHTPSLRPLCVGVDQPSSDFARYSDRYNDAPVGPFHKSEMMTMTPGVHFPVELLPPSEQPKPKKGANKRPSGDAPAAAASSRSAPKKKAAPKKKGGRGAAAAAASTRSSFSSAAASSSAPPQPQLKRLRRNPEAQDMGTAELFGEDLDEDEEAGGEDDDAAEEGGGGGGSPKKRSRRIDDDDDDDEPRISEDDDEEEDEEYDDDEYGQGFEDFEDGGDDFDDGGDHDEPEY